MEDAPYDLHPITGKKAKWELVQDWTDQEGEGKQEVKILRDAASGEEHVFQRHHPKALKEMTAIEKVYEEARQALTDAGEDLSADGILWLSAMKGVSAEERQAFERFLSGEDDYEEEDEAL